MRSGSVRIRIEAWISRPALVLAVLWCCAGCEFHLHLEEAYLTTGVFYEGDPVGGVTLVDPGRSLVERAEEFRAGLRLTIPFDLGWAGPWRPGLHWMPDSGYPTGVYAALGLVDGRR